MFTVMDAVISCSSIHFTSISVFKWNSFNMSYAVDDFAIKIALADREEFAKPFTDKS